MVAPEASGGSAKRPTASPARAVTYRLEHNRESIVNKIDRKRGLMLRAQLATRELHRPVGFRDGAQGRKLRTGDILSGPNLLSARKNYAWLPRHEFGCVHLPAADQMRAIARRIKAPPFEPFVQAVGEAGVAAASARGPRGSGQRAAGADQDGQLLGPGDRGCRAGGCRAGCAAAMSRCQRKIVPGVTISRIAARRSAGTVPASSASHARSGPAQGYRRHSGGVIRSFQPI